VRAFELCKFYFGEFSPLAFEGSVRATTEADEPERRMAKPQGTTHIHARAHARAADELSASSRVQGDRKIISFEPRLHACSSLMAHRRKRQLYAHLFRPVGGRVSRASHVTWIAMTRQRLNDMFY
jgi:hypothetical protein